MSTITVNILLDGFRRAHISSDGHADMVAADPVALETEDDYVRISLPDGLAFVKLDDLDRAVAAMKAGRR